MTDADTILDATFVEEVEKTLENDPQVDAVAGYVKSQKHNVLTALRELDYILGQDLHKNAQDSLGIVYVIPGCAAAFKTEVFRDYISFDHDTITEDLDFTYRLHAFARKIVFNMNAVVYTQDPDTLHSYIHQMRRWYGGAWQNLRKHRTNMPSFIQKLDTFLTFSEGLLYPFVTVFGFVFAPHLALHMLLWLFLFTLGIGVYGAFTRGRIDLLLCSPLYLPFMSLNAYINFEQFIESCILKKHEVAWFKPPRRVMI
jgi:biofilm PGA synthesis N-glycosyltransferase PgaC